VSDGGEDKSLSVTRIKQPRVTKYLEVYIKQYPRQGTEGNTISHSYTFNIKQGRAGKLIIGAA
jgi:hypothetical protein